MLKGEKRHKELYVTHRNFSVKNGKVKSGEKYVYSEASRRYEVLCLDQKPKILIHLDTTLITKYLMTGMRRGHFG